MVKAKMFFRFGAVMAALVPAVSLLSDTTLNAKTKSRGATLTGTWFVSLPGGLTGFYTYNQHGTMTGVVSTIFGAPPQLHIPANVNADSRAS